MTETVVEAIGLDIPVADVYPSFTERYFIPRYCVNAGGRESEDHCVLFHSNKICVVTLAPSHPVIRDKKVITKINFQVTAKINRLNNAVKGKGKHGAQFLKPLDVLCMIECVDESRYSVRSCVAGKLIEINEALVEKPQLLVEKPNDDGYVAVVLPNKFNSDKQRDELMEPSQYHEHLSTIDPSDEIKTESEMI